MMERRRLLLGGLAAGIAAPLLARRAMASPRKYPGKPIRMIIPFPAAGVTDISARLLAAAMAEELGQTIIPENKPGAAGNIAAKYVADAAPDGYTILFNNSATHGINPTLFKSINFDAERDFTPILYCSSSPNLFVANKNFPGDTIADFVDIARQQGPAVMMALGSLGSSQHMAAELLRHVTATQFTTVPYRGGALAFAGSGSAAPCRRCATVIRRPSSTSAAAPSRRWASLPRNAYRARPTSPAVAETLLAKKVPTAGSGW